MRPSSLAHLAPRLLDPAGAGVRPAASMAAAALLGVLVTPMVGLGWWVGTPVLALAPLVPGAWGLPPRLAAALLACTVAALGAAQSVRPLGAAEFGQLVAVAVLLCIAVQLAATRERAARRSRRHAAVVGRASRAATSGRAQPDILERICAAVAGDGRQGCVVALLDDRDELYVAASRGHLHTRLSVRRLEQARELMAVVASSRRPLVVDDLAAADPPPVRELRGARRDVRSLAAVPIVVEDRVTGVLRIDADQPRRFTTADLAFLAQVAAVISGALQQSDPLRRVNEQLRHRVHELTVLQETARRLAGSLDLAEVDAAAVELAGRGLGGRPATLVRLSPAALAEDAAPSDGGAASVTRWPGEGAGVAGAAARLSVAAVAAARRLVRGADRCIVLHGDDAVALAPAGADRAAAAAPVGLGEDGGALLVIGGGGMRRALDPAELALLAGITDLVGLAAEAALSHGRVAAAAITDELTGLFNRRHLEHVLSRRQDGRFAILAIDVDDLKQTNDTLGHPAGDALLRGVAAAARGALREQDLVARAGGDEFVAVLPGADAAEAAAVAERMRLRVRTAAAGERAPHISVGVAAAGRDADPHEVWRHADAGLYRAKRDGRDRVVVMEEPYATSTVAGRALLEPVVVPGHPSAPGANGFGAPAGSAAELSAVPRRRARSG